MKGKIVGLLILGFFVFFLLLCTGLLEPPFMLVFGWIWYLMRVVPEVHLSAAACIQDVVVLTLLVAVGHWLARWLFSSVRADRPETERRWRFRWTLTGTTIVILMFVVGISMLALTHQVGWMLKSEEPVIVMGGREATRRATSLNNLKQIGLGFQNFASLHDGQFPAGGTFDQYGEMRHGWVAGLLPCMEREDLHRNINYDLPWNDPDNAKIFRMPLYLLLNPRLSDAPSEDKDGYALNHYSANSRVVGGSPPMKIAEITDGTSHTILTGEVSHDFKPWGHPLNWRDPADGLNTTHGSFGISDRDAVTIFGFADGSVRAIRNDIDPEVLRALATPAAGDSAGDLDEW